MPVPTDPLEQHLQRLLACRACPGVQAPPVVGAVPGAQVVLVGQAPGPRERDAGRPFVFTAGTTLFRWFGRLGVTEEEFRARVYMAAVIRCFPGKMPSGQGDRAPSRTEMETCGAFLAEELSLLRPQLVVPVGRLAIARFLPKRRLDEVVGQVFEWAHLGAPLRVLPLPHPSGLSRWIQGEPGHSLLHQALTLLSGEPAWREAFPHSQTPRRP